jgi:hypothetical protein
MAIVTAYLESKFRRLRGYCELLDRLLGVGSCGLATSGVDAFAAPNVYFPYLRCTRSVGLPVPQKIINCQKLIIYGVLATFLGSISLGSRGVDTVSDTATGRCDRETAQKDNKLFLESLNPVLVFFTSTARHHFANLPNMGSLPDWEC